MKSRWLGFMCLNKTKLTYIEFKMLRSSLFSLFLKENRFDCFVSLSKLFHQSSTTFKWRDYNEKIYPPQSPDEEPRPAFVCHVTENIKYSPKKLWYIACLVRGLTVDEAVKQLQFLPYKGAVAVRETILEAQKMAVEEHNVEFKTNLWVSESFVGKGWVIKGFRRCAKKQVKTIRYRYSHYFVTLEEGTPPKDYYYFRRTKTGEEMLNAWLEKMRGRKISHTL